MSNVCLDSQIHVCTSLTASILPLNQLLWLVAAPIHGIDALLVEFPNMVKTRTPTPGVRVFCGSGKVYPYPYPWYPGTKPLGFTHTPAFHYSWPEVNKYRRWVEVPEK
jgi:hypothetical protein